ncbi:MAG TPA: phage holin family protein [Oceanithermus profundus]|uniref:Phage holin family protein n=1 Tax=Oceanithermus profundus TaxID=187137 RepID=A0A7C4Z5W7_9DEIN|nr:phage holin family protein [Oceanithermus profundus]
MRNFLIRWILNTLALWVVAQLYGGVNFATGSALADYLIAGLVLGLANALVRPLLLLLTLPLNLLTLGLFTLVVNALVLLLVAEATALEVVGFAGAFWGALLLSVVSWLLDLLLVGEAPKQGKL